MSTFSIIYEGVCHFAKSRKLFVAGLVFRNGIQMADVRNIEY
jgi:hypothetical protein